MLNCQVQQIQSVYKYQVIRPLNMSITTETQRDRFKIATGQQVSKGPTPNQIQENDYNIYFFEAGDERSEGGILRIKPI